MPYNCYAEKSLTEMCGLWMRIFWHPRLQKYSPHQQQASADVCGWLVSMLAVYSVLLCTKKLQCERNEWRYTLCRL